MRQHRVQPLLHYLDDFLTVGPPNSNITNRTLTLSSRYVISSESHWHWRKLRDQLYTSLSFLGITLDTVTMEAKLSPEKFLRLQLLVTEWLDKSKATKRDILSIVGHLQHATKVIRQARTFVSRLYIMAAKVKKLNFYTRLNREFRSDLCWWNTFLHHWNGLSLWGSTITRCHNPDRCIRIMGLWGLPPR